MREAGPSGSGELLKSNTPRWSCVNRKAILIDIGGVLAPDSLGAPTAHWSNRLGISRAAFLAALFDGDDDHVLIGRTSEDSWWRTVGERLGVDAELVGAIRSDLASRGTWDEALVQSVRSLRGAAKTAIVSNAWPQMRTRLTDAGLLDLVDAIVLSCEVGCAKPDPRIYAIALERVGAQPADALFIDDTPEHVDAARSLGMTGHVHTSTEGTIVRIQDFLRLPE